LQRCDTYRRMFVHYETALPAASETRHLAG
jgi:hypothetical protein